MSPRPIAAPSNWLPELSNHGIARALLVLGLVGACAELVSTVFVPRLLLYLAVLGFGAVGLLRRRRADRAAGTPPSAADHAAVTART